jgi:glycogen operon protein
VEGDTDDPRVMDRRRRLQRALLTTLFAAQGVPMIQGGDELGRTQAGNNNAYCQDNALTWLDWKNADRSMIEFTTGLIGLRRRFGQLRLVAWLTGAKGADGKRDIVWWHPDGREMQERDWQASSGGTLGMLLASAASDDGSGKPDGSTLLALFNRNAEPASFRLPPGAWRQLCASSDEAPFKTRMLDSVCSLAGQSVLLLTQDQNS